jgi:hypothetical protein
MIVAEILMTIGLVTLGAAIGIACFKLGKLFKKDAK